MTAAFPRELRRPLPLSSRLANRIVAWGNDLQRRGMRLRGIAITLYVQRLGALLFGRGGVGRWALRNHYFWLPCVTCGEWMGGHEWRPREGYEITIPNEPEGGHGGIGICPACVDAGIGNRAWAAWNAEHPETARGVPLAVIHLSLGGPGVDVGVDVESNVRFICMDCGARDITDTKAHDAVCPRRGGSSA